MKCFHSVIHYFPSTPRSCPFPSPQAYVRVPHRPRNSLLGLNGAGDVMQLFQLVHLHFHLHLHLLLRLHPAILSRRVVSRGQAVSPCLNPACLAALVLEMSYK